MESRSRRGNTHQHVQRAFANRVASTFRAAVKPYRGKTGGNIHDGLLRPAQEERVIKLAEEGRCTEVGLDDLK